jgi:hypothetical protein
VGSNHRGMPRGMGGAMPRDGSIDIREGWVLPVATWWRFWRWMRDARQPERRYSPIRSDFCRCPWRLVGLHT